jgi:hypothetical protein
MKHLKDNNVTYFSHLKFASIIAITLFLRSFAFFFHAILPIYDIPKRWNLQKTKDDLNRWYAHAIQRKKRGK